jgi:hypothetical protein
MVEIAGKQIATPDAVVIGAGIVGVINLFLPWYKVSAGDIDSTGEAVKAIKFFGIDDGNGDSATANGFTSGFLALLPALLIIAVAVIVALRIFRNLATPAVGKVGPALLQLGLAGLALVLLVLKLLVDHSWVSIGLFLAIVLAAAQTAMLYPAFKASGEAIPDLPGRPGGGTPPPPPAGNGGYPPPPPPTV